MMEGGSGTPEISNTVAGGAGPSGTSVACRWNPTKEQINMLESLYGQGLRTPTAEQIQEITGKLQAYGHIEGKNVFYWFQNHKARQRQKEKQDHLSLFRQYNHQRHRHQPFIHLPPPPNVVYEPCFMPQSNLGFYVPQHQQIVSPCPSNNTIKRRSPRAIKPRSADVGGFTLMHQPENAADIAGGNNTTNREQDGIVYGKKYKNQETLDLFPLHPTGVLQERVDTTSNGSCLASSRSNGGVVDRLCFDFFC